MSWYVEIQRVIVAIVRMDCCSAILKRAIYSALEDLYEKDRVVLWMAYRRPKDVDVRDRIVERVTSMFPNEAGDWATYVANSILDAAAYVAKRVPNIAVDCWSMEHVPEFEVFKIAQDDDRRDEGDVEPKPKKRGRKPSKAEDEDDSDILGRASKLPPIHNVLYGLGKRTDVKLEDFIPSRCVSKFEQLITRYEAEGAPFGRNAVPMRMTIPHRVS